MKILIDLTSLADNFSGIERYAASISLGMLEDQRNSYILVFKGSVHPLFSRYISQHNVRILVLKPCHRLLFNQFRLPWAVQRISADCYLFLAFPVPVLLAKRNMFSAIHDICCWDCPETMKQLSALYFRISNRVALVKCRRIITVSKFSEDRIVERLHVDRKKLWRIYDGVDHKFSTHRNTNLGVLEKYGLPDKYLLSLSTLEPRKNLALLIRAYGRLVTEEQWEIPLVLAGRKGWKMDDLLSGVPECVRKQIHFTGFVDDEDLPDVYANSKLFVFPSLYEGFGIPPLEAMACGTPVLSSDAASLPEILGDAAVYFENNNEQSLYEALKQAVLAEKMFDQIQKGKLQAARFDWKQQAGILLEKLQNLLQKP